MDFNPVVRRARSILVTPRTEWRVIAAEPATVSSVYTGYVMPLAAIPAVCAFVRSSLIGYRTPVFGTYRESAGTGAGDMLIGYGLSLATIYLMALIIDALAPSFGATKDRLQALKTAAYAYTASYVAGIGQLLPLVGWLVLLAGAAYSIYLLFLGLPETMKAPRERAAGYTAVVVVVAMVLGWLIVLLTGGLTSALYRPA